MQFWVISLYVYILPQHTVLNHPLQHMDVNHQFPNQTIMLAIIRLAAMLHLDVTRDFS